MKKIYSFSWFVFCCLYLCYTQQTTQVDLTGEALTEKAATSDMPLSVQQGITKAINRAMQRAEQVHLSNPTFSMDFTCEGIAISPQKNDLNWAWQLQTFMAKRLLPRPRSSKTILNRNMWTTHVVPSPNAIYFIKEVSSNYLLLPSNPKEI